jgi:hypothetical protein
MILPLEQRTLPAASYLMYDNIYYGVLISVQVWLDQELG